MKVQCEKCGHVNRIKNPISSAGGAKSKRTISDKEQDVLQESQRAARRKALAQAYRDAVNRQKEDDAKCKTNA